MHSLPTRPTYTIVGTHGNRAHSQHVADVEGRAGIERARCQFVLEAVEGANVRGAVDTCVGSRHSKGAGCSGRGSRAGGSSYEKSMSGRTV